jgi:hypothetical protein
VVFGTQDEVYGLVGCPRSGESGLNTAVQRFEHGWMVWEARREATPASVYALFDDTRRYARFDDTFSPQVDPLTGPLTAPPGLQQPTAGFGKVWREASGVGVRQRLGWATVPAATGRGALQTFQRGHMVWTPNPREVFVLAASTADRPPQILQGWRAYADSSPE